MLPVAISSLESVPPTARASLKIILPPWLQHAPQLAQQGKSAGNVAKDIVGIDCVRIRVRESKRLRHVALLKTDLRTLVLLVCQSAGIKHAFRIHVETHHLPAGGLGQLQRIATRSPERSSPASGRAGVGFHGIPPCSPNWFGQRLRHSFDPHVAINIPFVVPIRVGVEVYFCRHTSPFCCGVSAAVPAHRLIHERQSNLHRDYPLQDLLYRDTTRHALLSIPA